MQSSVSKVPKEISGRQSLTEAAATLKVEDGVRDRALALFDIADHKESVAHVDRRLIASAVLYISELVVVAEMLLAEDPKIITEGLTFAALEKLKVKPNKTKIIDTMWFSSKMNISFNKVVNVLLQDLEINQDIIRIIRKSSEVLIRNDAV